MKIISALALAATLGLGIMGVAQAQDAQRKDCSVCNLRPIPAEELGLVGQKPIVLGQQERNCDTCNLKPEPLPAPQPPEDCSYCG